jgi:hypothetical protein
VKGWQNDVGETEKKNSQVKGEATELAVFGVNIQIFNLG